MANGTVKFKFGGVARTCRIELSLAPKLETATGKGIFTLARSVMRQDATTSDVVEIIRETLAVNGVSYEFDAAFDQIEHGGLLEAYSVAAMILAELLKVGNAKGKKSQGESVSPPPNISQ